MIFKSILAAGQLWKRQQQQQRRCLSPSASQILFTTLGAENRSGLDGQSQVKSDAHGRAGRAPLQHRGSIIGCWSWNFSHMSHCLSKTIRTPPPLPTTTTGATNAGRGLPCAHARTHTKWAKTSCIKTSECKTFLATKTVQGHPDGNKLNLSSIHQPGPAQQKNKCKILHPSPFKG